MKYVQYIVALSWWKKMILLLLLCVGVWWIYRTYWKSADSSVTYETEKAKRGALVVTVNASGTVASTNSTTVTTEASGVVSEVFFKDGDTVRSGDIIAKIDLDMIGKQRSAQALSSYLSAQNSVRTAEAQYFSLQSDLFTTWKTYTDLAQSSAYEHPDHTPKVVERQVPEFMSAHAEWRAAEETYKRQEGVLSQAKQSLTSAWLAYQQSSADIISPISGAITGLSLQKGIVITPQQGGSTASNAQKIASIKTDVPPSIVIDVTEIDVPSISVGQEASVIFDAFSDKTFSGRVVSVDTIGSVTSGVTNYPVVIQLSEQDPRILPNMRLSASIVIQTKQQVLLVPVSAVQYKQERAYVQVMKSGKPMDTRVEVGTSSDTHTEILSGLSEKDTVVTATISSSTSSTTTTSPFSPFGSMRRRS